MYSWKLVETDRTPPGKRNDISLREKIKQIDRDVEDGIKIAANNKITLNDMFDLYMAGKLGKIISIQRTVTNKDKRKKKGKESGIFDFIQP